MAVTTDHSARKAGIVLAAGESTRFGAENKLTAVIDGGSVIGRTVTAYLEALPVVFVVLRPDQDSLTKSIQGWGARVLYNPNFGEGQSTSLRVGISALPSEIDVAVVGPADMPLLRPAVIDSLLVAYGGGASIAVPVYGGRRGSPTLFARSMFDELVHIFGDVGGRAIMRRHTPVEVPIADAWSGFDIDTMEDLAVVAQHLDSPAHDEAVGGNSQ